MAGPWEDYAPTPAPAGGPWEDYKPAKPSFPNWKGFVPHPSEYPGLAYEREQAGERQAGKGLQQVREGGLANRALWGPGNMLFGSLGAISAPISAAYDTAVGKPVERGTGSEMLGEVASFGAAMMTPNPLKIASSIANRFGPVAQGARGTPSASTVGGVLSQGAQSLPGADKVKGVLAPSTVDEMSGKAAQRIVKEHGEAAREYVQSETALRAFDPVKESLTRDEAIDLTDRLQTGSATNVAVGPAAHYEAHLTEGYKDVRERLEELPRGARMRFREFYAPNKWIAGPGIRPGDSTMGAMKQGSSSFMKEQSMTLREGMAAGYTPKTLDPTQAFLEYKANADRFIATEKIIDQFRKEGHVKYFFPNSPRISPASDASKAEKGALRENEGPSRHAMGKTPAGKYADWVPLEGRIAHGGFEGAMQAYAPPTLAKVFNEFTSPGVMGSKLGDAFMNARKVENAILTFKLLGGYHAMMETVQEAPASMLARGIGQMLTPGQRGAGAGAAIKSAVPGLAAVELTAKGKKLQDVYKGLNPKADDLMKKITDLYAQGGGRFGRGASTAEYDIFGGKESFRIAPAARAFMRAFEEAPKKFRSPDAIWQTVRHGGERIKEMGAWGVAKAAANNVGRTVRTISAPIFDWYIPKLKAGAFSEQMGVWLKANPAASENQTLAAAQKIVNSVENRFGEMTRDNIFMNKALQQVMQLATVSYSYELGTIRELGGGALDMFNGKALAGLESSKWSPRANYVVALPITQGMMAAMYQYMKIGEAPRDAMDLIAPRTGGKTLEGEPERAAPIGYMKDLRNVITDPAQWAKNKENPAIGFAQSLMTGKDWRGKPLVTSPTGEPTMADWVPKMLGVFAEAFTPISAEGDVNPKSKIGWVETVAGIRPGGQQYTRPEALRMLRKKEGVRAFRTQRKFETKHYGGPQ